MVGLRPWCWAWHLLPPGPKNSTTPCSNNPHVTPRPKKANGCPTGWTAGRLGGWSVWLETDVSVVEELLGQTTNNLRDAAQLGQPSWSNSKLTNVLEPHEQRFDNVVDNWGRYVPNHVRIGASKTLQHNLSLGVQVGKPGPRLRQLSWTPKETTWWPAGTSAACRFGGSIPVLRRPLQRQLVGIPKRGHLRRWTGNLAGRGVRQPRACLRTGLGGKRSDPPRHER